MGYHWAMRNIYSCDGCGAIAKASMILVGGGELWRDVPIDWKSRGKFTFCPQCASKWDAINPETKD